MRTDMRADRRPLVAALFAVALALAAPCAGQESSPTPSDSASPAPSAHPEDTWYPEGLVRIRGKRYSFFVGATYTSFMNANARGRFGQGTWSPTFELYRPQRHGYSPIVDVNGTQIAEADSSARIVAVSVGVRYRPVDADRARWVAFSAGVAVGPRFARISGLDRTTVGGVSVQVGLEVLRTARVTARYEALPTVHGVQLSTLSLGAAVRLWPHGGRASRVSFP